METEITSKSELETLAKKLSDETILLGTLANDLCSTLGNVSDYDGIPASSAGRTLSSNLKSILEDFNTSATNINSYISELISHDVNDFPEEDLEDIEVPTDIELPELIVTGEKEDDSETEQVIVADDSTKEGTATEETGQVINPPPTVEDQKDEEPKIEDSKDEDNTYHPIETPPVEDEKEPVKENNNPTYVPPITNDTNDNYVEPDNVIQVIETQNIKSENGLTQRSALTDIKVTVGENVDISNYTNNAECGFEVTTHNYSYQLCEEDVELLYAIIAAEGDKSYDDSLALITTLLNRCENKEWVSLYGKDPIAQATALDQFTSYQQGNYKQYLDGNVTDTVKQAVNDALLGVRNHDYLNFSTNDSVNFSNNMITTSGNRYK